MTEEIRRKNLRMLSICIGVMIVTAIWPWIYAPIYKQVCATFGIKTTSSKDAGP